MSSDHNGVKLEISNKDVNIWDFAKYLKVIQHINIPWVEEEFRKIIKPLNGMRMEIKICVVQLKQ